MEASRHAMRTRQECQACLSDARHAFRVEAALRERQFGLRAELRFAVLPLAVYILSTRAHPVCRYANI